MNAQNNWSLFYHKKKKKYLSNLIRYRWIFMKLRLRFFKYRISITLRNVPFHENREFDYSHFGRDHFNTKLWKRSIDRSLLRRRWDELERRKIAGRKPREEEKKKKEKHQIILTRPIVGKKLTARSLSLPVSVKEKADFLFTSKRSDRSRYFVAIWNSIRAFLLNSKARTLNGEAKSFLFRRTKRKRYA